MDGCHGRNQSINQFLANVNSLDVVHVRYYVIARPSVCRLSVTLRALYPTQAIEILAMFLRHVVITYLGHLMLTSR